jgi:DNA repair protein RecN (Recombination protein N)
VALRTINLRDFVIVRELALDLGAGFTVLTGETGAGKSILIDALQIALGARADAHVIREGATRAEVAAEFDCPTLCHPWLHEAGFEVGDTLLLRRTLEASGKSRAWINGSTATAAQLRDLGSLLLDIHGQHAWQSLTRPESVRGLLDGYAQLATDTLAELWQHWRKAQKACADAQSAQTALLQEHERLTWQIGELEKLAPGPDEWEELNADHARLSHAQALMDATQAALQALEDEETGTLLGLTRAHTVLTGQSQIEPQFQAIAEVLATSLAQAEDAVHSLHAYLRKTNLEPERLAELDARMSLWVSLARRFRRTPTELPALLASWKQEVSRLEAAADLDALTLAEQTAQQAYLAEAQHISAQRQQAAPRLAQAVTTAMQELGMRGGRFEVRLEPVDPPSASGLEEVIFLVAGHPGSTPRPVGKVASGGELSRIALAIAVTTSQLGSAQTLIFDEVDSGVGGAVAETVGRLMKQLGHDRQVLAVTHLPQVAACADHHLVVAKQLEAGRTVSSVKLSSGQARVAEIARMLGGERLSETTLAHAREMLDSSNRSNQDALCNLNLF